MKKWYQNKFALTARGAENAVHATMTCFMVYVLQMCPVFLFMKLLDDLDRGNAIEPWLYYGAAAVILLLLYLFSAKEYDNLYNTTYKESADLRVEIGETLRKLPLSYFSRHALTDVSQTIMNDVAALEHALSHSVPRIFAFAFFFLILSVALLIGNVWLGLAVIVPVMLSFALVFITHEVQISAQKKYFRQLQKNSEAFQEAIEMEKEIRSFSLTSLMKKKLNQAMDESEKIHIRSEIPVTLVIIFSSLIGYLAPVIVIPVGLYLYEAGDISLLYVVGYFLAALKVKEIVDVSEENVLEVIALSPKTEHIRDIQKEPPQEGENRKLSQFDVVLSHVGFSYDGKRPVCEDISFTAKQGEVTALVGKSGCGKSTLLRLISRLYDYDKGHISIGGQDIKKLSTDSLFSSISMVFQEVILFNQTVMENIRLGRQTATDEEVYEAARLAGCDEFVKKLPQGYDTLIGENGASLSGGERQRISIARAFLKEAPILLLDEIMASLDIESEKGIQDSLTKLMKNKTVIIISHRLKAIEKADKIVVIDEGRVETEGTHEKLKETSPRYRSLMQNTKEIEAFTY